MQRIQIVDSHTGGEPTRVVVAGGPDLGAGSLAERRLLFASQHDAFRRALICEPRGSNVLVGALLVPPTDPGCLAGVIFFNNVGVIGMCGHGTIGLAATLGHLGKISAGRYELETPVGRIAFEYDGRYTTALDNVPSYRFQKNVSLEVPGLGRVNGDVAWGGNWFFLVNDHQEKLMYENVPRLLDVTRRIRDALSKNNITGA
ncbi:MAG TPA: proline racemase family protein, partial [Pirellulales bacterium]